MNNTPPFAIGQKIVRVKPETFNRLQVGKQYVVSAIEWCCSKWGWKIELEGIHWETDGCECGNRNALVWAAKNFAPITESYADMTAEIAAGCKETSEVPDKVIIREPVTSNQ